MGDRSAYGGLLALFGFAIAISFIWFRNLDVIWLGMALFLVGLLLLPSEGKDWYCAACGQHLGKGEPSSACDRCGSNRVTDSDPGVVDAVRTNPEHGRR